MTLDETIDRIESDLFEIDMLSMMIKKSAKTVCTIILDAEH